MIGLALTSPTALFGSVHMCRLLCCALLCFPASPANVSDFCLIRSATPCAAAGVFTLNAFCAAPVVVSKSTLAAHSAAVHGVAINAGCANACTGSQGLTDAAEMQRLAAQRAGVSNALVMSTGVIGPFLPMDKIRAGFESAAAALSADDDAENGWAQAALAIMTTDTHPKVLHRSFSIGGGKSFTLSGICKGAGMIHPNMATMLAVVATDLSIAPEPLQVALKYAADRSFNSITIDGDTSTNDSLVVLANGQAPAWRQPAAGQYAIRSVNDPAYAEFQRVLTEYCTELSHKIVRDGEGATKFVTVRVTSSRSYPEAKTIANSIATSMLVKTALFGGDANWGRILCAVGYAGVQGVDPARVNLYIRPAGAEKDDAAPAPTTGHSSHGSMGPNALQSDSSSSAPVLRALHIVKGGQPFDCNEAVATALFQQREIVLHVDLGMGSEEASVFTCDLSLDYVKINADYRS